MGGRRLSRPPAVVLRLPWASIIPVALGAATSGAQSTQWVALLVGGRAGHSPILAEPQPRRIEATRGQGRCPKVSGGRRAAAGRPPSLRTRPCLARRATAGSPLRRRGQLACPTSSCCRNLRAVWAAGTLHVPQRPAATGTQRQHATWAAALLGRPPRLPSLRRRRRPRSSDAPPIARSIEVFSAGWQARWRGVATAWLCPPQRHKHASGCRRGCGWARRDLGCRRPQHARGLLWARVWAAPLDWTARCGRRNPVGYARFAPPAVTPAIAVTPRNNPCVTCVTCVTRRMYVCLGDGERGPKFH